MLRDVTWHDVTWRDVTEHFLHAVPWLNYYETFWLYGFDVVYLTVAEQFYLVKKKKYKSQKKEGLLFY